MLQHFLRLVLIHAGAVVIKDFATMSLDHDFSESLNDPDSKDYKDFSQDITSSVSC